MISDKDAVRHARGRVNSASATAQDGASSPLYPVAMLREASEHMPYKLNACRVDDDDIDDVSFKAAEPAGSSSFTFMMQPSHQSAEDDVVDRRGGVLCFSEDFVNTYALGIIVATISWLLSLYFREIRPNPYVDEVYHIPQAQNYCAGNLSHWDDKITTLPGLYLCSAALLKPLCWMFSLSVCCTVFQLRLTNVFYSVCGVFALWFAHKAVHGTHRIITTTPASQDVPNSAEDVSFARTPPGVAHLPASVPPVSMQRAEPMLYNMKYERALLVLNLSFFPVLYFFSFLFYTEQLSMLFVLLCMLTAHRETGWLFVICATFAVLARQTNIVWVIFFPLVRIDPFLYQLIGLSPSVTHQLRQGPLYTELCIVWSYVRARLTQSRTIGPLVRDAADLLTTKLSYMLLVVLGFVAFFMWNGGKIVVGDKTAHLMVLHLAQYWYFFIFAACWAWPVFLVDLWQRKWQLLQGLALKLVISAIPFTQFYRFFQLYKAAREIGRSYRQIMLLTLVYVAAIVSLYWYAYDHPYLLADNRHYTHILWRKLLRRGWLRLLLAPLAVWCAAFVVNSIRYRGVLFLALYLAATFMVLVPQQMLEFRYFLTPYFIWRLYARPLTGWVARVALLMEAAIYLTMNMATIYAFGNWPITSGWNGEVQHYMW